MEHSSIQGDIPVLEIEGELDRSNVAPVKESLLKLLGRGGDALVVDLTALTYLDSAGVALIILGLQHMSKRGGRIGLVARNPDVRRILEIVGLTSSTENLVFFESRELALESLRQHSA